MTKINKDHDQRHVGEEFISSDRSITKESQSRHSSRSRGWSHGGKMLGGLLSQACSARFSG